MSFSAGPFVLSRSLMIGLCCVIAVACSNQDVSPPLNPASELSRNHATSNGWNEQTLFEFDVSNGQDAGNPIIRDSQGNLYGTTSKGGDTSPSGCSFSQTPAGCGVVFELSPSSSGWKQTLLHKFAGPPDGEVPFSGLARDTAGNLYGTTVSGGRLNPASCDQFWQGRNLGCGTVFTISASGRYSIVHRFKGEPDGYGPAGITVDPKGNLYGTTEFGGANNAGTVFKIDRKGKETVLYSFQNADDGGEPIAPVVRDDAGDLFGTTQPGSSSCYNYGECGTVFELNSKGKFRVLYTFTLATSGLGPNQLIRDSSGTLYGTAWGGGSYYSVGSIWKISRNGAFTQLYAFTGYADGQRPYGAVLRDRKGELYGTAWNGAAGGGTVWKLNKQGKLRVLYTFPYGGSSVLSHPKANLVEDSSGNLYGPEEFGGVCSSCGGVFEVSPGTH